MLGQNTQSNVNAITSVPNQTKYNYPAFYNHYARTRFNVPIGYQSNASVQTSTNSQYTSDIKLYAKYLLNICDSSNANSPDRLFKYGYYLGRLVAILQKTNQKYINWGVLSKYSVSMAKAVIIQGLVVNKDYEQNTIDFGFAIGFIQQYVYLNISGISIDMTDYSKVGNWHYVIEIGKMMAKHIDIIPAQCYFFIVNRENINWDDMLTNITEANAQLKLD